MYVLIAGGGKVGANLTRSLLRNGHEVTVIEQRPKARLGSKIRYGKAHGGGSESAQPHGIRLLANSR